MNGQTRRVKRVVFAALAVSTIVAGGTTALTPRPAQAAESSRVLYREYFAAGSGNGELVRAACTVASAAARYGVSRTEAQVTWDVFNVGGVSYNRLDCVGYTVLNYSPYRPIRAVR